MSKQLHNTIEKSLERGKMDILTWKDHFPDFVQALQ